MELSKDKVMPIKGQVQHYAWGGDFYLPKLLNLPVNKGETYAEYWLGAHNTGSAELISGDAEKILLKDYIHAYPAETLGQKAAARFGGLPYLLKVLDVKEMLSIQVHPAKAEAQRDFESENARGIELSAPQRNYKDNNHKPELMLALSEFWLLHGFKPVKTLDRILHEIPELHFLVPVFGNGNYKALYQHVMEMPQAQVNRHLKTLLDRIVPHYQNEKLKKNKEDFWAARAAITYSQKGDVDRGIFSIYFFNLLQVQPGHAVFQDAGVPHAYLEGQNVEIMANSDNVLRGGLTPKHVDVPELLKHMKFEPTVPHIIHGVEKEKAISLFPTPAPDFELGRIHLAKGQELPLLSYSVQIFLVLAGSVEVKEKSLTAFSRKKGEAWVSFDAAESKLKALEDAVIYRAAIPLIN
ncbi:MAG: mannose-6-phosphate isomerase, class I [Bacteroidota bacterium]|nr:mannose-6-phosphate isomerase, class I [Bacteroidota bacterium]MDP4250348.1 mannose-6-phosphate isomerase, class I [Bacteroidota bacterium]